MEDKNLQVENGNFTRIINPVIDNLIKIPFKGCEIPLALFIIRKTWGFQKTQDEISLTQIEKGLNRSRPTIVKALKNLQLVNILKLVKRGSSLKHSNIWAINKYIDTWELVKVAKLVKGRASTSKGGFTETSKGGLTHKRKKDNTKENLLYKNLIKELSTIFEYEPKQNKTSIIAVKKLLKKFTNEDNILRFAEATNTFKNTDYPYVIHSPNSLYEKADKIIARLGVNKPQMTFEGQAVRKVQGGYQIKGNDGKWMEFGGDKNKIVKN